MMTSCKDGDVVLNQVVVVNLVVTNLVLIHGQVFVDPLGYRSETVMWSRALIFTVMHMTGP